MRLGRGKRWAARLAIAAAAVGVVAVGADVQASEQANKNSDVVWLMDVVWLKSYNSNGQ